MEKSDAIRNAVRQAQPPELPAGFTGRLMERMQRETRRRERRETGLLVAGGICFFGALTAICVWAFPNLTDIELQIPSLRLDKLQIPKIELPVASCSAESLTQIRMDVCIAMIALVLLVADLLIRRWIASLSRK